MASKRPATAERVDDDLQVRIDRIGQVLKERWEQTSMPQAELIRRTGLKQATVSRILSGKSKNEPRLSQILPLARALGLTIEQVLGLAAPPPPLLMRRDQEVLNAYYTDDAVKAVVDKLVPKGAKRWPKSE